MNLRVVPSFILSLSAILFGSVSFAGLQPPVLIEKTEITSRVDGRLRLNRDYQERYFFEFNGRTFIGYPNVFSPEVFPSPNATREIPINKSETFLEIGSGTGVFSIQAALDGASKVVAIDINPDAVENTKANVLLHHLEGRVEVLEGDLFSPL